MLSLPPTFIFATALLAIFFYADWSDLSLAFIFATMALFLIFFYYLIMGMLRDPCANNSQPTAKWLVVVAALIMLLTVALVISAFVYVIRAPKQSPCQPTWGSSPSTPPSLPYVANDTLVIYHALGEGGFVTRGPMPYSDAIRLYRANEVHGLATAVIESGQLTELFVDNNFRSTFMPFVEAHLFFPMRYRGAITADCPNDTSTFVLYHSLPGGLSSQGPMSSASAALLSKQLRDNNHATAVVRHGQLLDLFVDDWFRPHFMPYVNSHLFARIDESRNETSTTADADDVNSNATQAVSD